MQQTQEDIQLLQCLTIRTEQMRQGILRGRPYVWELRLSLEEFYALESSINNSISSHAGKHDHLLTEEFAVIVVMYLAEWYKRFYKGADTQDENKILALSSKELEKLYDLAGIDKNTFVYNASKNPDKTSFRWLESMQVLGGLAVQAELKRDDNDKLLTQLCKIFHGEDIDLDDLKDRNRAVAFQESIARKHSLYEYLKCILEKDERGRRNLPFATSDTRNEGTYIPQLIHRIEEADKIAKKNKFDFEWIISYSASRSQMVRHLRVKLKPEVIGGGRKQYIGYDRLRQPEWGIDNPENIGRIRFYLRFKNGSHCIQKEGKQEEPLFKYDNTGSENTGFLSVNKEDENTYTNVPVGRFDKVEMVMRYDEECRVVQTLEVKDYMQVYSLPKKPTMFSDRRNSQRPTFLIFSSAYHLTEPYRDLPVVYAHFRNGEQLSEDYCWCPINDKVIIADSDGKEVMPPFFNRNGLFQVVTKKYLKTIKYRENLYVLYQYIDAEYDEYEYQEDEGELNQWLRTIKEILDDPQPDAMDFLDAIKLNLFASEIFVFTPKGEIKTMPANSTVLDFAFSIHTFLGSHCIGAKVNHKLVPMSHHLNSGDQVEILTSNSQHVQPSWITFATTAKAKAKVQAILRRNGREAQKRGEEVLDEWLTKHGFEPSTAVTDQLAALHDIRQRDTFLLMVGEKRIILGEKDEDELKGKNKKKGEGGGWRRYVPFVKAKKSEEEKQLELFIVPEKFNRKQTIYINEDNIGQYIFQDCCHPIPGDDILGYIDNQNRIEIHKRACPVANRLKASFGNRILDVRWDMHKQMFFDATIRLGGIDRRGLVNEVTRVISNQLSVDIHKLTFTSDDGIFDGSIDLRVHDRDDVKSIINSLKEVDGLKEISQIM